MIFFYFKALHIIGFVAWFAGLFYLVRIFVYHAEAAEKPPVERDILVKQFSIMERRVFKLIANPAMMFTVFFGFGMIAIQPSFLQVDWFIIKLFFLVLLIAYHFYCQKIIRQLEEGKNTLSSFHFRLLNEVPTLFLVVIVLLAVVKNSINVFYLLGGTVVLGIFFYFIAKAYKLRREKKSDTSNYPEGKN